MNKTKIEWTDYTWNPISGCKRGCFYCYARKTAERFRGTKAFPNGFEPTFHKEKLKEPFKIRKRSKIFVCSMGEMFGPWVKMEWIMSILCVIRKSYHTFQILTKYPERASYWNFPKNVWLGVTVENALELPRIHKLKKSNARIKFVSFEPLLSSMQDPFYGGYESLRMKLDGIDWVIIGAQTNPLRIPEKEWVKGIVEICKEKGIPVFTKDNLFRDQYGYHFHPRWEEKIQEFPKEIEW